MKFGLKEAGAGAVVGLGALAVSGPALAEVEAETAYVLNTFSFLVSGFLVMWMAAGFAMLESGLVRTKNTATICLKNITLYSVAGLMYYIVGYNLMYVDVSSYIGSFGIFYDGTLDEAALAAEVADVGYSTMSDWFFQMVFVATAASIVSGTVAERIKFWPFMIFTVVLTAIIYPVQASWTWGGGWLDAMGFSDYAGSTLVHSCGGWAALVGAIMLGPRKGKYNADGSINPIPGANLPLATLGTFVLWLGWFGFNGGSVLALGSAAAAAEMSIVYANTNIAAAAGVVVAVIMTQIMYKKIDLTMALNGAIGGLVAITAGPAMEATYLSIIVGGVGGALVVIAVPLIDKLKIDDVVGAISAHLIAGIWGTLCVGIFGGGDLLAQIVGIVAVGAWTVITSAIVWGILKVTIGLRASEEDEYEGLDKAELGLEAYPEFGAGSQRM